MINYNPNSTSVPRELKNIPQDGYIVLPLSISRLAQGQSPEECYETIRHLFSKLSENSVDWILLYTEGLYYNDERPSFEMRKFLNQKMLEHRNAMQKLIANDKNLPRAFHYLPWDYVLLTSDAFSRCYSILLEEHAKSETFRQIVRENLGEREDSLANQRFILEEVAVTHVIRQKMVPLPKKLVQEDHFRLIVYSGTYGLTDLYQWQAKLLPRIQEQKTRVSPYYASYYDCSAQELWNFDEMAPIINFLSKPVLDKVIFK